MDDVDVTVKLPESETVELTISTQMMCKNCVKLVQKHNYTGMIGASLIAILYFLARKMTAEYGVSPKSGRRGTLEAFNHLSPLRAPPRTLRLNSLSGYSNACPPGMTSIESFWDSIMPHVLGSPCIVTSHNGSLCT